MGLLQYWNGTAWTPMLGGYSLPSNSIVVKETVSGTINGSNTTFTTASPYLGGSLQVYVNGVAQSQLVTETTPASGVFDLDTAPETGSDVKAYYHIANLATGNADTLDGYHLSGILEALYPIGAIYISGSSTMPAIISGIGTWVRIEGRMIVGASDSDGDFDNGDTGGSKTHTLTLAQIPNVTGSITWHGQENGTHAYNASGVFSGSTTISNKYQAGHAATTGANSVGPVNFSLGGGGGSHPIMNPYKAKYMWERTA